MTDRPSDNGVPLRVVLALALGASMLARCVAPALQGVAGDGMIIWSARLAALVTLLTATGLVAAVARLATAVVSSPRAPLVARLVVVPAVSMSCLLLLFASFRPLEPMLALMLGVSAGIVGGLSARHMVRIPERRAAALVLGSIASGGLVHVLARKLTQDASDAANLAAFRVAEWIETLAVCVDFVALGLTLLWIQRRIPRGRWLAPGIIALSVVLVLVASRGPLPGASNFAVVLSRSLKELGRGQTCLLHPALVQLLGAASISTALFVVAIDASGVGLVLAASLLARAALDIPIPALLLELAALYLPFSRAEPLAPKAPLLREAPDTAPP